MKSHQTKPPELPPGATIQHLKLARWFGGCLVAFAITISGFAANVLPESSVKLAWDPSPDANVAGYRLHYGVAAAQYTNSIAVGNLTSNVVTGLIKGITYYFAVTAYDAYGMQSPFSNEISYQLASAKLQLRRNASRQAVLTVTGQTGHIYNVEATQNLTTWTVIGMVTPGPSGIVEFTDVSAASLPRRFYRLRDTTP